ncbi:hypothetical protein [Chroococcidiopsis sp. TS-821]|uniref:hypothetical protein n=1 Tax=Chroococcidiopsis sp. TS-821 TaxID=1378066 RepID=UPI000CEF3EAE|nr:hypothetical protein [Chroococcidiopsis sp. TS-821]PPS42709.1 hypothetical protein B1A85_13395 [Chroococcidiopsis sp. TS-821]
MDLHQWTILGASAICCWSLLAAPAVAEMKRIEYTLRSQPNQTFTTLMQEAEAMAATLVEQGFAEDNVTEVAVNILGERHGQQVPLLSSKVTRADWQKQPGIQQWTRYFRTSAVLLGFYKPEEPNPSPISAFPSQTSESVSNPTSGDSSIQQSTLPPSIPTSIQQQIPNPTSIDGSIQQPPPSPINPIPQINPTMPNTPLGGASPEESEPGYR